MIFNMPHKLNAGLREYFSFSINDDAIEWQEKQFYFLRVHPKNMSILSYDEKLTEIKKFQSFLDSSASRFSIFITDKTENLNDISDYYKKQLGLRPEYAFILEPIIARISSIEQSSACVQRAFYIVYQAKDRREYDIFAKQLTGRFDFALAQKQELILVMRNFILREYTPFDLYVFEDAVKKHYEEATKKARRNRKVEENPFREAREDNLIAIDKITPAVQKTKEPEVTINNAQNTETDNVPGSLWPHS